MVQELERSKIQDPTTEEEIIRNNRHLIVTQIKGTAWLWLCYFLMQFEIYQHLKLTDTPILKILFCSV